MEYIYEEMANIQMGLNDNKHSKGILYHQNSDIRFDGEIVNDNY